jgi:UPF0755 protein
MKYLKVALIATTIAVVAAFSIVAIQVKNLKALNYNAIVEVNKGAGLSGVAYKLEQNGIIYDATLFKLYALIMRQDKGLKPGEYSLSSSMSHKEILDNISKGKVFYRKITIPEGLTLKEITAIIEGNPFLKGDVTLELKEGYLLPETYYFQKGESADSIIIQMQKAFEVALDNVWIKRNQERLGDHIKTKDDLVNLASIVEKETMLNKEKPIVAAVYLNRLKVRMRLQADPTVIYGAQDYNGDITYKMLKEKNEYNTYTMYGLPKTPIANPGINSLKAVANPADVKFLYFVADGRGGHIFATNYENHRKNVKRYLSIQKQLTR